MDYQTLLGAYHFCATHHTGLASREYRVLCRIMRVLTVRGKDEFLDCLVSPNNAAARDLYVRLARAFYDSRGSASGINVDRTRPNDYSLLTLRHHDPRDYRMSTDQEKVTAELLNRDHKSSFSTREKTMMIVAVSQRAMRLHGLADDTRAAEYQSAGTVALAATYREAGNEYDRLRGVLDRIDPYDRPQEKCPLCGENRAHPSQRGQHACNRK